LEKVIVTGLLVIAAVTGAGLIIATIVPSIADSSSSVATAQREISNQIGTNLEIIAISSPTDGKSITAWVKNIGTKPILAISKSDMFLIKEGASAPRYDVLTYCGTDIVAIDCAGKSKVWAAPVTSWNRGDTLQISVLLSDADKVDEDGHYIQFTTVNGISDRKLFSRNG
tara:strand:+ start:742 stop:1251 length:510 start_codon:yes stop_codon:yes gene_type:complete